MYFLFLSSVVVLAAGPAQAAKECFFLNGDPAPEHSPCRPDDDVSPCCLIRNDTTSDICLEPTGLCLSDHNMVYQGGCTDRNGESNSCPHVCPDASTDWDGKASLDDWSPSERIQFWNVVTCSPETVCCRKNDNGPNCCSNDSLLIPARIGMPVIPNIANLTDLTSPTPGSNNSVQPRLECEASSSSNDTLIGAAVGVPLGVLLVAALVAVAILFRGQRRLRQELDLLSRDKGVTYGSTGSFGNRIGVGGERTGLVANEKQTQPAEMGTSTQLRELPS